MTFTRKNHGVCSNYTSVVIENGIIQNVLVDSGCEGNLKGVCELLKGKQASEAIATLKGITCDDKPTSCPDQIALCLSEALAQT